MTPMTIEELYEKLNSKEFQDVENGDLAYNYFMFQYDAKKEYEIRRQIDDFKENLQRPTNYVDVLTLDLFEEFCNYMDNKKFLKYPSHLQYLFEKEKDNPTGVAETVKNSLHTEDFMKYVDAKIMEFKAIKDNMKRPYVFVYGIGNLYPYLRVNEFLTAYEPYNRTSEYRIIVFYPGSADRENNTFLLFGHLNDSHTYKATILLNK